MKKWVFDVDGTLTPSRKKMDPEFKQWFNEFQVYYDTYLVTGSDKPKTVEQIGEDTYNLFHKCYQCQGNDVWVGSQNIRTDTITVPDRMKEVFDVFLKDSMFKIRTGTHIDIRPGLINFSVLGRGANAEERYRYIKWDEKTKEREMFVQMLSEAMGPMWDIKIAGETGIDIVPYGKDKSQILKDFNDEDKIVFFGDDTQVGGNDFEISSSVIAKGDISIPVVNWEETWEMLRIMS